MRFGVALLALPMIALAFSGCVGGGEMAARGGYSIALDRAHERDANAVLVDVSGLELSDTKPFEDAIAQAGGADEEGMAAIKALVPRSDGAVGDGQAPAWGYVFAGPQGVTAVVVDASGSITYAREAPTSKSMESSLDGASFSEWTIDSDRAAQVVADHDAGFRALSASANGAVSYELSRNTGRLVWDVRGGDADFTGSAGPSNSFSYQVDAMTGELVNRTITKPPVPTILPREAGAEQGSLSVIDSTRHSTFSVKDGHDTLELVLSRNDVVGAANDLQAKVTSPDGTAYDLEVNTILSVVSHLSDSTSAPMPTGGKWTVDVTLAQGATSDYAFSWCTDGIGNAGGDNEACQQI
ncbi:MAG: hypothetical protein V4510_04310 [bacterium]